MRAPLRLMHGGFILAAVLSTIIVFSHPLIGEASVMYTVVESPADVEITVTPLFDIVLGDTLPTIAVIVST
jgi:hypothetical protein